MARSRDPGFFLAGKGALLGSKGVLQVRLGLAAVCVFATPVGD